MDQTAKALSTLRPRIDDDLIDKVNYFWTCLILVICSLTIAMRQYVGRPLQCWVPQEFKGYWQQYAEDYCFVENTYFVPMNDSIPDEGVERVQRELGYYQWVPIVLALQAFLFFLPRLVWGMLNTEGLNVQAILQASLGVTKGGDRRQRLKGAAVSKKDMEIISQYYDENVKHRRATKRATLTSKRGAVEIDPSFNQRSQTGRSVSLSASCGYYITVIYMIVKLAYIANVIGQFFLMNAYLAPSYTWWGFGILDDLWHGRQWHDSGHFPRVTLCDFTIRKLGQLQTYTIQCVLSLNMLNERMYLFLWWWFLLVAVLSILSLLYWLPISFSINSRRRFVARYMLMRKLVSTPPRPETQTEVKKFIDGYLKADGVLVLRLIAGNAGEIACANMVQELWNMYKQPPEKNNIDTPTKERPASPDTEGFIESPNSSLISG